MKISKKNCVILAIGCSNVAMGGRAGCTGGLMGREGVQVGNSGVGGWEQQWGGGGFNSGVVLNL